MWLVKIESKHASMLEQVKLSVSIYTIFSAKKNNNNFPQFAAIINSMFVALNHFKWIYNPVYVRPVGDNQDSLSFDVNDIL